MKNKPHKFYDILIAEEGTTEATILLYGYIGEYWSWNPDKGYEQVGVTDVQFVKELNELAKKYSTIHLRINSPGGEIFHGAAIVSAIQNCPAEIHTWNDGVCASMAAIIWMAGKKRHMAKNAMLMLHSASGMCWGNASDMRKIADVLDKFDQSLIISAANSVGMEEDAIQLKYFNYEDHWLTYNDVQAESWLSPTEEYEAAKLPTNLQKMPYRDLVEFFEAQGKSPKADTSIDPGILERLREVYEEAKTAIRKVLEPSSIINTPDMTLQDFKASLADGKLNIDEVKAHIDSLTPPPATPEPPAATATEPLEESEPIKALRAEMEQQKQDFDARLKALGEQPGAGRSIPTLPAADAPGATNVVKTDAEKLEEANRALFASAAAGDPVQFSPAIPRTND